MDNFAFTTSSQRISPARLVFRGISQDACMMAALGSIYMMKTLQSIEVLNAIYSRRAIRRYTAEPVGREVLEELVNAAIQAPSARGLQPWGFAVVMGSDLVKNYSVRAERYLCDLLDGPLPHPIPGLGGRGRYLPRRLGARCGLRDVRGLTGRRRLLSRSAKPHARRVCKWSGNLPDWLGAAVAVAGRD